MTLATYLHDFLLLEKNKCLCSPVAETVREPRITWGKEGLVQGIKPSVNEKRRQSANAHCDRARRHTSDQPLCAIHAK